MTRRAIAIIGRPPWRVRRTIVNLTLVFCAGTVAYLLAFGADTDLQRTIASGSYMLAGSVIGAYVFGAVWDDANVMRILGRDAYRDQVPYQEPAYQQPYPVEPAIQEPR